MKRILSFFRQFPEYFLGTCLTLLLLGGLLGHSYATTSYLVANEPQMFLDANLTTTQTTGIILASPTLNGSNWQFSTTSGGVLRIRQGTKREDLYYGSATIGSDNRVTLVSVIRNLCPQTFTGYISCGAGQQFSRGAIVELNQDARLFNLKAAVDRINTFQNLQHFGSGVDLTGSGYALELSRLTTNERNAMTNVKDGRIIYNKSLGTMQIRAAGAWINAGSGSTVNGSETTAGKVQGATIANQLAKTGTGTTGTALFLQPKYLASSGGTLAVSRVPILGANGVMTGSMLGTNASTITRANSGSLVLFANQTWTAVSATTNLADSGSLSVTSFATGALLTVKQTTTTYFKIFGTNENGHYLTGGSAPTITSCGGGSVAGNDTVGRITAGGTAVSCAMYFNKRHGVGPGATNYACTVSQINGGTISAVDIVHTASGITVTNALGDVGGKVFSYTCFDY